MVELVNYADVRPHEDVRECNKMIDTLTYKITD